MSDALGKAGSITLVVPTMNEIQGMRAIMPQVRPEWVDQVLVIDGGSTDGTLEYAADRGYDVVRQNRKGIRQAYIEAWPRIRGDFVITFSPDGNSLPEYIPPLVDRLRQGFDLVIVSRYMDWAKSEDDTVMTSIGNWVFTKFIGGLAGYRYTDAMVIYRGFRRDLIDRLDLRVPRPDLWERHIGRYVSWEPQMALRAGLKGVRISEIPGHEPLRIGSESRIRHYRVALSCVYALVEDKLFWK